MPACPLAHQSAPLPALMNVFYRKKKPQRNPRPEIPESLIMRQQQLKEAGITSEIRWDKLSREYYLAYKNPGLVPAWN